MQKKLFSFFITEKIFTITSLILFIFIFLSFLDKISKYMLFDYLSLFFGIFIFILSGFYITPILQFFVNRNFTFWEFVSLSLLNSILTFPLIFLVEFFILGKTYNWLPIVDIVFFWVLAGTLILLKKSDLPVFPKFSKKQIFSSPIALVLIIGIIITLIQVLSYPALPDLDPYAWFYKYTIQFAHQHLDYKERPLFGSLTFIGTQLLGVSIFNFFKYVLPFLFLSTLFPGWMIARRFTDKKKQLLLLMSIFISPVVILYAQTPMTQAPLLWISYFFVFFLLYSMETKDDFFLYIAGIAMFLSFLYHQASIIIFAIWFLFTIFSKRKLVFSDKKTSFLIFIIIASNLSFLTPMYQFSLSWTKAVYAAVFKANNLNLFYPAIYTNVDRNAMGWGSLNGVIKFYAFHMGPLISMIFLFLFVFFVISKKFRKFLFNEIKKDFALMIVLFSFLMFFIIAEILPRFPNIALLPDRAWVFAGIFSIALLYLLLKYFEKIPKWTLYLFILSSMITISGALYINYLKKYLIAPEQIQSAEWIKQNLPKDRIFISYGHKHLIPIFSNSPLIRIDSGIYCSNNLNDFYNTFNEKSDENIENRQLNEYYFDFLSSSNKELSASAAIMENENKSIAEKYNNAVLTTNKLLEETSELKLALKKQSGLLIQYPPNDLHNESDFISREDIYDSNLEGFNIMSEKRPLYIYYAKENPNNPYASRPYSMTTWGMKPCTNEKFLFDQYPEKFKRVYYTKDNSVIIWKIL